MTGWRSPIRWLSIAALITLSVCTATLAQDAPAAATSENPQKPDPRLDQKVTYRAVAKPIRIVLDELSQKTGVQLDCGANLKDWQVRDRKVSIFVKDMPLRDLSIVIADVLHFTWSRETSEDTYSYRLFQDIRAKQKEKALRNLEEEGLVKLRQKAINEIDGLDALSSLQLSRLKTDSPFLFGLAREPLGKALRTFIHTVPYAEDALNNGTELTVDASRLSVEASQATKLLAMALDAYYRRLYNATWTPLSEIPDQLGTVRIAINPLSQQGEMDKEERARNIVGNFRVSLASIYAPGTVGSSDSDIAVDLYNPKSKMAKTVGLGLIQSQDSGTPAAMETNPVADTETEQTAAEREDSAENPGAGEETVKKIKLDIMQPATLDTVLEEIANKADLQIISDCFDRDPIGVYGHYEGELQPFVKKLAKLAKVQFGTSGRVVAVVDNKWYIKRSWAVADDWIDYWNEQIKKGRFDLDDAAKIASLTDDQIVHTILHEPRLANCVKGALNEREALQFYNVLSSGQKQALITNTGLDPAGLRRDQMPHFSKIFTRAMPGRMVTTVQPKNMKLMIMRLSGTEKGGSYALRLIDRTPDPLAGNQEAELATWTALLYH